MGQRTPFAAGPSASALEVARLEQRAVSVFRHAPDSFTGDGRRRLVTPPATLDSPVHAPFVAPSTHARATSVAADFSAVSFAEMGVGDKRPQQSRWHDAPRGVGSPRNQRHPKPPRQSVARASRKK